MKLSSRDRLLLALVGIVALVGAYYMLALKPERQQATQLNASISSQQQALSTAESDYAAGRAAAASLKVDAAAWAALRQAVPAESDIPALLRILQANADAVGVGLQAITLNGSPSAAAATAPGSSSSAGGSSAAAAAGATAVPLQLTFEGGYAALDRLVHRLDGLVVMSGKSVRATGPLLTISNVSLSRGSANSSSATGSSSSSPSLSVQLTATIYQLNAGTSTTGATNGGQS